MQCSRLHACILGGVQSAAQWHANARTLCPLPMCLWHDTNTALCQAASHMPKICFFIKPPKIATNVLYLFGLSQDPNF